MTSFSRIRGPMSLRDRILRCDTSQVGSQTSIFIEINHLTLDPYFPEPESRATNLEIVTQTMQLLNLIFFEST